MPSVYPDRRVILNVDTNQRLLRVMEGDKIVKSYPVAVGSQKTPTPVGGYTIIHKAHWGGAFGTRWMGLSVPWGTYGIHGTNKPASIGKSVSHGCIRMLNRHVEEVYDIVAIGTQVEIKGKILYCPLALASRGNLVQMVQARLKDMGLYQGTLDGIFSSQTAEAVARFQQEAGLKVTAQIYRDDLEKLGVWI
ncbi:MAG TPA: L,D-transpeptidase family protein [Verrucomicrobiae bacterium]|nr:L,D-transpeptidase family protein [Verrucomicrobiae bacterium]